MPTKERAAAERARKTAHKIVKEAAKPDNPRLPVVTGDDVAAEQAATRAAYDALRPLSAKARYRALNWLRDWVHEESDHPDF